MFRKKSFLYPLYLFLFLTGFFFMFLFAFSGTVPFHSAQYTYSSHHYLVDPQSVGQEFNFLHGLSTWDSQWYLKIAVEGYPTRAAIESNTKPGFMGAMTYAFFPFYPVVLSLFNLVFQNILLTAFILSLVLLVANFMSLYYVVTKLFSRELALKTLFLLYLFPFSLFYRAFYTESIFLLILIWTSYFLIKKQWFASALTTSLLYVTRPNGIFMSLIFIASLIIGIRKHKLSIPKALLYTGINIIPLLLWFGYCYVQTGNPFYWQEVQGLWFNTPSILHTIESNLSEILSFFTLPLHNTFASKIEVATVIITAVLLIKSKRFFKKYPQLWWISLIIFLVPLLVKDLNSYTRYQVISFPLFIYLAASVRGITFYILCALFFLFLLFAGLHHSNWHWVG